MGDALPCLCPCPCPCPCPCLWVMVLNPSTWLLLCPWMPTHPPTSLSWTVSRFKLQQSLESLSRRSQSQQPLRPSYFTKPTRMISPPQSEAWTMNHRQRLSQSISRLSKCGSWLLSKYSIQHKSATWRSPQLRKPRQSPTKTPIVTRGLAPRRHQPSALVWSWASWPLLVLLVLWYTVRDRRPT